jgi:hypothetical protein
MVNIVFSFKKLSQNDLTTYAGTVVQKMTTDTQFKALKPQVEALKTALDAYNTAVTEAMHGGKLFTIAKNECKETVLEKLEIVARYVSLQAETEAIVMAAGFEVKKTAKTIQELITPSNLSVVNAERTGAVRVSWEKVSGAINYALEMRTKADAPWQNGKYTTATEIYVTDIQPGTFIEFRNRSLGRKELVSEWAPPVGVWVS